MIEAVIELVFQIAIEVLLQAAAAFGWESVRQAVRRGPQRNPLLPAVGQMLMGAVAGGISVWLVPTRLTEASLFPGISVILSPLVNGLIMDELGDRWSSRGRERPALFNFRAGACFAFGMALVRFLYFRMNAV